MDIQTINKRIGIIRKNGAKMQDFIHDTMVATLEHVKLHGDYRPAESLLNALPSAARANDAAYWYDQFSDSKLTFVRVKGAFVGALAKDRMESDFDVENATKTPFYVLRKDSGKTTRQTVESMMKRLQTIAAMDDDKADASAKILAARFVKEYEEMKAEMFS